MRPQRVGLHLVVAATVAVVVALAPVPSSRGPLGVACAEAAGPDVALVVDFGDVASLGPPPGGVESHCVPHASGLTGAAALQAAGYQLRFGAGGLLCSINGFPAEGCGEKTDARRYLYWSYWKGDGTDWQYSGSGPAVRLREGSTEGWRFVEGAGSPSDPRPRRPADHTSICGAAAAPAPPAPPGAGVGAGAPPASVPAPADPGATAPAAPPPTGPGATPPDNPPAEALDGPSAPVTGDAGSGSADGAPVAEAAPGETVAATARRDTGGITGALAVAALVVGLTVAAVVRSRRRRGAP